jgi:hypothetical protein
VADTGFDETQPLVQELRRIGAAGLRKILRQRGIRLEESSSMPLPQFIQSAADSLLRSLEGKMGLSVDPADSLFDRIRAVRREVHRIRIDPERAADHEVAATWADEAMTALRVLSYSGQYLDQPTLDRVAETTEKLVEDTYSRMGEAYAPRVAYARVAEPIRLSAFLKETPGRSKNALQSLARLCERRVQEGIDAVNASNPHPGGKPYGEKPGSGGEKP